VNHQPEFAAHCVTPVAEKGHARWRLALACTAIDLASDGESCRRLIRSRL
jgi:hypothetical protein